MQIFPYEDGRLDGIVRLSLRAWEPVFASLEQALDGAVYRAFYPDWRAAQQQAVEAVCRDPEAHVVVAADGNATMGFAALKLNRADRMGEISMIAVDPDYQRRGVATALTQHALEWFQDADMSIAMVETGGDPGHAPVRHTYESVGFRLFEVARYFRKL